MDACFFEATSDEKYQQLLSNDENSVSLILDALGYLRRIGLDLAFLLDFVLWGSDGCICDATIRHARTCLTHYKNLTGILNRLWKPPRNGRRADSATDVVVGWAFSCVRSVLRSEMQTVAHHWHLKCPAAAFSTEDLHVDFHELMQCFKHEPPNLWSTLCSVAWTDKQDERNTMKTPDWVCGGGR